MIFQAGLAVVFSAAVLGQRVTKYTGCNPIVEQHNEYMDRHAMDCGSGYALAGFRLMYQSSSGCGGDQSKIEYYCEPAEYTTGSNDRYTGCSELKEKTVQYFDRHDAQCGANEIMRGSKLLYTDCGGRDGRLMQTCLSVRSTSGAENLLSGCNDLWDKKLQYLDRHTVSCPSGKFLTKYRLLRCEGSNNMQYHYTCMAADTAPNRNCAGSWSECQASCADKTYTVTTTKHGDGVECEAANNAKKACAPGEGACPPNIACVGSWSACEASCADKTYTVTTAKSGNGAECEAGNGDTGACAPGDGDCPPNTACVGSWSTCEASCADKTYTVTTPKSGNGAECEAGNGDTGACAPGDGDCPLPCPQQLMNAQKFQTNSKAGKGKKIKGEDVDDLACQCETLCKSDSTNTYYSVGKVKKNKQGKCSCHKGEFKMMKKNKAKKVGAAGGLTDDARTAAKDGSFGNPDKRRRRRRRGN